MANMNADMLLGSAIQLIRDIERIAFLGERIECLKIHQMAGDWLNWVGCRNRGADMRGESDAVD